MRHLRTALVLLELKAGHLPHQSPVYTTHPWGNSDQPDFLNMAVELHTAHEPRALLDIILEIERSMGRERGFDRWRARIIDIDILLFEDFIHTSHSLHIPHPLLAERRFVLQPLADIAPDLVHPQQHKTIAELLKVCPDPLGVEVYHEEPGKA